MHSEGSKIFITMGDIHGIGPEVVVKALTHIHPVNKIVFVLVGVREVLDHAIKITQSDLPIIEEEPNDNSEKIYFVSSQATLSEPVMLGTVSAKAGSLSAVFIREAVSRIQKLGHAGLVTAPISKEALWEAGVSFPGQTEYIADLSGTKEVAMMLLADDFRVGFITTHYPLKEVPGLLNQQIIEEKCKVFGKDLRKRFGIETPRLAITAFNPHGGEHGRLGTEEKKIIIPAVKKLQKEGLLVDGPFSADTLFMPSKIGVYDVLVAMYHDQGMIPIKMHAFGKAVNYTAGLPFVRTSPDHGSAFDIAGKGIANESSMVEAIKTAIRLVHEKSEKSSSIS